MPQGYGQPVQNTRPNPYRLRQDLGYVPARSMAEGDGGGGITSTGGPTAPVLTLTPIALGDFLANLSGANPDVPTPTSFIFTNLQDVPNTYVAQALKLVRVNAGATALEFHQEAFTDLVDAPANYTGAALKIVRVNAAGTGLEFATLASTASFLPLVNGDTPGPGIMAGNQQVIGVPYTVTVDTELCPVYLAANTLASRPATPAVCSGATAGYLATDTGKFFVWTGAAWAQTN
jgi:hypothetical protein